VKPESRSTRMYAQLRADVLAGRLRPGQRLQYAELCDRYSVSVGVAREVLTKLTAEGLAEAEVNLGFRVMPLSVTDLNHLTEARCAIEPLVLRLAIEHGGIEWETHVVGAHHRLERTPQMAREDPDRITEAWAEAHAVYHSALLAGCPNLRLCAIAKALRDSAELYRRWSVPLGHEDRDIAGEHHAILNAIIERDADEAAAILVDHIQHTTQVLLRGNDLPDRGAESA